ncbi:clumping factor B [Zeugodacus cucurbitae]|uniref:Chaperone protein dnaK2 n=1 Tax=Zeugodacus cucurbitae TaxID=28588 RepID=A0A0A1XBB1_ZEUCU|nr:clumping factor B [Zeugodacus cucurbitae]
MKSYLVLICSVLLVGAFCAVLAAPGGNINNEPQTETEPEPESEPEPELTFPDYSINPTRVLKLLANFEDESVSISESNSESNSDSSSSSRSVSSSEENEDVKPEGRTLFLILRLLQLLSQQNSTSSG